MSPTSDKTIRIRSIPKHNGAEAFASFTERLTSASTKQLSIFQKPSRASTDFSILTSLACQQDEYVGTISFLSKQLKEKALRDRGSGLTLDDKFDGITVLHSPEEPELEYVFLHKRRSFACMR
jgi:hypothetical protein